MGSFLSIPILVVAAIAQSTFAPQIQLLGGRPDLVFLLVLAWSIHANLEEAVVWAFIGGISQDLLSALPTGTSTLGMLPVIFFVNSLNRQLYSVGLVFLTGLVIGGTLVKMTVDLVVLLLTGFQFGFTEMGYVILPTLFYNLVFIWPIYWFVRRLQRRLYR